MQAAVIFGGTGFIGLFYAEYLVATGGFSKIYLVDIESIDDKNCVYRHQLFNSLSNFIYIKADVRHSLSHLDIEDPIGLIANFAAIHREPGHEDWEYYETNLLGAKFVCEFAERVRCETLLFTSSISPYGASESRRNESSLPIPDSAYGGSKLIAEHIHRVWQARNEKVRRLVIVRPGVVFGPGEGGNVSRLIKSVINRYFIYMGNKNTRKAGIYVKELCCAMDWVLRINEPVSLCNMTMYPAPTIQQYVTSICRVASIKRIILKIPYPLLLLATYFFDTISRLFNLKHPFSPVRIRKLVRSNDIEPKYLLDHGYIYQYSLLSALEDWRKVNPKDWI